MEYEHLELRPLTVSCTLIIGLFVGINVGTCVSEGLLVGI